MGIMTSDARQFVPAGLFTLAQRQGFHLRDGAKTGLGGARVNKVSSVVCQEFSGTELRKLFARPIDEDFSFQMALLANRVSAQRVKLCGIEDSFFAAAGYVPGAA